MPRGATPEEDARIGEELMNSSKNRHEHAVVVDTIKSALGAVCDKVQAAEAPGLLKLANVQHLYTPITGQLQANHSILELVEQLHPTPAVGGLPNKSALEAIREREQLDRGWYAAPVGWLDAKGDGEFVVALRSALLRGNKAVLFVGCGIMGDSDPATEYQESCLKAKVMLSALS
jgi:isochorismate synthase